METYIETSQQKFYRTHKAEPIFQEKLATKLGKYYSGNRYKKYRKKANMLKQFRKFIKKQHGLIIMIDDKWVITPIIPKSANENDDTPYKIDLFKKEYRKIHKPKKETE